MTPIDFQTEPARYRHWRIECDGQIAFLVMDVDPAGGISPDYELKLNSYDLAVDIELNDAVQRLRFEHPEVRAVVIKAGKENVFCAGANIRMLGKATHGHKVNFCKFTNETRLAIEDASENSRQIYLCAVDGSGGGAAGGRGGGEIEMGRGHQGARDGDCCPFRPANRCQGHQAAAARAEDFRRYDHLSACAHRDRARARHRHRHRACAHASRTVDARSGARARQPLLAACGPP